MQMYLQYEVWADRGHGDRQMNHHRYGQIEGRGTGIYRHGKTKSMETGRCTYSYGQIDGMETGIYSHGKTESIETGRWTYRYVQIESI